MDQPILDIQPKFRGGASHTPRLNLKSGRRSLVKGVVVRFGRVTKKPYKKCKANYCDDLPRIFRKLPKDRGENPKDRIRKYKSKLGRTLRTRTRCSRDWDNPIVAWYPRCSPTFYIPNTIFAGMNLPTLTGGRKFERTLDISNGKAYRYNPMVHEKYLVYKLAGLPSFKATDGVTTVNFLQDSTLKGINLLELCRSVVSDSMPSDEFMDDFAARAEKSFITVVPVDTSVINNALEIAQMLEGNAKAFTKLKTSWKHAVAKFHLARQNYKAIGAAPGNLWVSWRFAIRPTLKDAGICFRTMEELRKMLLHLRKVNRTPHTRRYRTKLHNLNHGDVFWSHHRWAWLQGSWSDGTQRTIKGQLIPPSPPAAGIELPARIGIRIISVEQKLCATSTVQFDVNDGLTDPDFRYFGSPDYTDGKNSGNAAYATLVSNLAGMYDPWDIMWEAIPYSWAIDWCLSEKEKLNRYKQFKDGWINPYGWAQILDSCHSLSTMLRFEIVFTHDYHGGPEPLVIGEGLYRHYVRQNGLPDKGTSSFRMPFSAYQASIVAGILSSRTMRRLPAI